MNARTTTKALLRGWGVATSALRPPPDYLVIGAKRGGTTSLCNYLLTHPGVLPLFPSRQHIKGTHFFDTGYHRGADWYWSHFPTSAARRLRELQVGHRVVVGEGSPYYLFHPLAARRASSLVPEVKLIVLLRDPVERAYSHWKERVRHGAEHLSFEDALAREPERVAGERERMLTDDDYRSFAHEHHSYLSQGLYEQPVREWLYDYRRSQMLVLRSEDFYADPQREYDKVLHFLALPPHALRTRRKWNYHPADDMAAATRERLDEQVAEHNARLSALLNMSFEWSRTTSP